MAKWVVCNAINAFGDVIRPGRVLTDGIDNVEAYQAAGATLIQGGTVSLAAAAYVQKQQAKGMSDSEASAYLLTLAGQTSNGRPSLAWYPENEAGIGRVTAWADVQSFIEEHDGNCSVIIAGRPGSQYTIPSTAQVNGHGALDFLNAYTSITESTFIRVEPGAVLRNVRQIYCTFDCGVTGSQSPFVLDEVGASLQVREGGGIFCQAGSVSSPVRAEALGNQVVFYYAGQVVSQEPTVAAIQILSSFFIFAVVVMIGTAELPANTFGGDASPTIIMITDANFVVTPQPLLLASFSAQRQTAQAMLRPSASNTAGRPSFDLQIGQSHFDTDLGYRIDWNGTDWVDSQGNVV